MRAGPRCPRRSGRWRRRRGGRQCASHRCRGGCGGGGRRAAAGGGGTTEEGETKIMMMGKKTVFIPNLLETCTTLWAARIPWADLPSSRRPPPP